jgi:hypothetical protein
LWGNASADLSPEIYRVSFDGVEVGSISLQPRHVHPMSHTGSYEVSEQNF